MQVSICPNDDFDFEQQSLSEQQYTCPYRSLPARSFKRLPHVLCVYRRASLTVTPPSPPIGHLRCTCSTHPPTARFALCTPRWRLPVLRIRHHRV
ncbi:hypothetical protein PFLUV_G00062990 [Perca fluviatilis]|uniref:Uncharacterized protein n=1 Tax=Perca fluviatilis TaxID=8168 RepID=A0A6A5FE85_PERFL|nr:hypothetical protein PFLUV_G00062990 [Perca fluviatilis]